MVVEFVSCVATPLPRIDQRCRIGYHCWSTYVDEYDEAVGVSAACRADHYVYPDGWAEVVTTSPGYDRDGIWRVITTRQIYSPGTWREYAPVTTFGSRGGCWVDPIPAV